VLAKGNGFILVPERLLGVISVESSMRHAGFLNHFWIQVAVSEVKRPLRNRFRSETVTNL
jgi:hypothetical protein